MPKPFEPGGHLYVRGYGPCQVWAEGDVPGYTSRWVTPTNQQSVYAVLVYWTRAGAMKVERACSR